MSGVSTVKDHSEEVSKNFLEGVSEFLVKQTLGGREGGFNHGQVAKVLRDVYHRSPNEYAILDKNKKMVGFAHEIAESGVFIPYSIKRANLRQRRQRRPLTMNIKDSDFKTVCYLDRKFHLLASRNTFKAEGGEVLFEIPRQFKLFHRKYNFLRGGKRPVASISSPIFTSWSFPVFNPQGRKLALIKKEWPSFGEYMNYRNTLSVKCTDSVSLDEKLMILGGALVISLDLFGI